MSLRLSDMTWHDVRAYLERSDALIVPVGTCEQHGLHLPLSTDTLIAEAFARRLSDAAQVALAPTLAYGVNLPCDRYTPGNAGLTFDALRASLRSLLSDWSRQGFGTFFVLTAHACAVDGFGFAHHEAIKEAALPLLSEGESRVFVLFPYWTDVSSVLTEQKGVGHACEVETSLALHLFPQLVKEDAMEDPEPWVGVSRSDPYIAGVAQGPPPADWRGGTGSPSAATSRKGEQILELCLSPMVEFVKGKLSERT
jgi:creatinine amidohydrolase